MGVFGFMAIWGLLGLAGISALAFGGEDFLTRGWVRPSPEIFGWCLLQAVGSLTAVILLTRAYQLAEASTVSVDRGGGALIALRGRAAAAV